MFTKTTIALCSVLVLAAAYGTVAQAQTTPQQRKQAVQPHISFEQIWFSIPQGEEG